MPEYLFSEFKNKEFDLLHKNISTVINVPKTTLGNMYKIMQEEFEVEEPISQITLPRNIFHSQNPDFQQRYDNALIVGVDIPSLLEKNDGDLNKKTIVIVGQDPRRRGNLRIEEIEISTPYAMHKWIHREKLCNTRLYFDLIKVLLDKSYRVYLTDIFKIWVSEPNRDRVISLSRQDKRQFVDVLRVELEIFAPLTVITWGQVASTAFRSLNLNVNHQEFPHPSGAANYRWRQLMGRPATRENRINFWRERMNDVLPNQLVR